MLRFVDTAMVWIGVLAIVLWAVIAAASVPLFWWPLITGRIVLP